MHPSTDLKSYDPLHAQEFLDTCNRDLEELRSRVLRTSVRCHTLEVDLATQFSPHIQQLLTNAQEACQQCSQTIDTLNTCMEPLVTKSVASIDSSSSDTAEEPGTSVPHADLQDMIADENAMQIAENSAA